MIPDRKAIYCPQTSLARALRIELGAVVSFVGAGGKTTSMFRWASKLYAQGLRVVTTAATHVGMEQAGLAPASENLVLNYYDCSCCFPHC